MKGLHYECMSMLGIIKYRLCFALFILNNFFLSTFDIFLNALLKKKDFLSGVITKTQGFISISGVIRQQ